MKKLTDIQELELRKRKIHEKKFKEKYPNGCFSIQIRYGRYGWKKPSPENEEKHIQLRWGIKKDSTQYWFNSFTIDKNLKIVSINNSFGNVKNYNTLEKLIEKCKKENINQKQIDLYIKTYNEQKDGKGPKIPHWLP